VTDKSSEFFEGTEMPTAGWWQALWHNPASVVAAINLANRMEVVDLCCGDRAANRESRAWRHRESTSIRSSWKSQGIASPRAL
jgi:hypothetical protein